MNIPFFSPDFAAGAVLINQDDLTAALQSVSSEAFIDDEYAEFLQLDESKLAALVARAWDNTQFKYGENGPEEPCCYDFAEIAASEVRKYAIKAGLKRPAFGVLRYTMNATAPGGANLRHAINWARVASGKIKYFEPQPVDAPWMDEPQDLKTLDNLYI